jgi:hypothetical protein
VKANYAVIEIEGNENDAMQMISIKQRGNPNGVEPVDIGGFYPSMNGDDDKYIISAKDSQLICTQIELSKKTFLRIYAEAKMPFEMMPSVDGAVEEIANNIVIPWLEASNLSFISVPLAKLIVWYEAEKLGLAIYKNIIANIDIKKFFEVINQSKDKHGYIVIELRPDFINNGFETRYIEKIEELELPRLLPSFLKHLGLSPYDVKANGLIPFNKIPSDYLERINYCIYHE